MSPALALELNGVQMPDQIKLGKSTLTLNGMGTRKATIFNVKVYVAGLYLENPSKNASEIIHSNQVKKLDLKFLRDVSADQLTSAWKEGFEKNCNPHCRDLSPYLSQLNQAMSAAKAGTHLSLTFYPEYLQVQFGGAPPMDIKNAEFGKRILSIWLGAEPPNRELKTGLLGHQTS